MRPQHTRWLAACVLGLLLAVWAAGLSFSVVFVFAVVFAAGAALLGLGTPWATGQPTEPDGPVDDKRIEEPSGGTEKRIEEPSGGTAADAPLE